MNKSVQKLSIFLIKEDMNSFSECIPSWNDCQHCDLNLKFGLVGKIVIGQKNEETPTWADFLARGTSEKLDYSQLENSSSRAVLLLHLEGRYLALSFGFGRYLLNDEYIDKTFGLKVVLNSVNPKKLKTVELATLSDNTVLTKRQSTRNSSKEIFGVDIINNLLCAVSGEPNNTGLFGKKISGREQLILSPKVDFTNLKDILVGVLAEYKSDSYKEEFSWIDDIQAVKDRAILDALDSQLIQALMDEQLDFLDISLPEVSDEGGIEGYAFIKKGEIFSEPQIRDFLASVSEKMQIDIPFLKRRKLHIQDSISSTMIPKWSIYGCLHFQTSIGNDTYVIFGGQWYKIDNQLVNQVVRKLDRIIAPSDFFFGCSSTWTREEHYNKAFAESDTNQYILLDQKLVKCENARSYIEACDVLSSDGVFYHIKHKKSSSSLSHLFAQGKISAESFLGDQQFRKALKNVIKKQNGPKAHLDIVPIGPKRPNSDNFSIVFGIIDSSNKSLKESLPFFSQLNLTLAYDYLTTMLGFKVSAVKIKKQ